MSILYRIRISFQTGNSFRTYSDNACVEHRWQNLDIAIQNLARIKEHYQWYKWENSYKFDKDIFFEKPSYVNPDYDSSILLIMDDGSEMYSDCFWVGYFEKPDYAKIEIDSPKTEVSF